MTSTTANVNVNANPAGKAAWILLIIAWLCFLLPVPGLGLFLGLPLNLVAFILAIVALSKGGAKKGLLQLLSSLIVSPIVYFIGLAILGAGIFGAAHIDQKQKAAAAQAAALSESGDSAIDAQPISVTATTLYKDYQANEISADGKYKGKPLLITGTIDSIQSDFSDNPIIQLATGEFGQVQLKGIEKSVAAGLSKGEKLTASCNGAGEVIGSPTADNCTIN